jgi:gliding motility-associated-like protein
LTASSNKGCVDSASEEIIVVPDILIFIPNAFSPNHKGPYENNKFRAISVNTSEFKIRIYNRFGQKVFETSDITEGWDGNYLGKPSQSGVYIYNIELKNKAGTSYNYQGTLNLLR